VKAVVTMYQAPTYRKGKMLNSSSVVYQHVKGQEKSGREIMTAFLLNAKNRLLHVETLGIGTVDSTAVYPAELLRVMLIHQASAVVLVHNHPSGDPDPSACDKELTKDIVAAARLLQMKVQDHIILGDDSYYSMADAGLIDEFALHALAK
jgi:DNA repair protein RadC